MGQIFHFAVRSADYPATTDALDTAECVFLLALRWWVADYCQGTDPIPRLRDAMHTAGAHDAAFAVDQLMAVVARTVRRPAAIHCPRCPHLSDDEKALLYAAGLVQAGKGELAERALRTTLLSASGAEFVLGPLEGLGVLFAEARLLFRKRHAPAEHPLQNDSTWRPSDQNRSIH